MGIAEEKTFRAKRKATREHNEKVMETDERRLKGEIISDPVLPKLIAAARFNPKCKTTLHMDALLNRVSHVNKVTANTIKKIGKILLVTSLDSVKLEALYVAGNYKEFMKFLGDNTLQASKLNTPVNMFNGEKKDKNKM